VLEAVASRVRPSPYRSWLRFLIAAAPAAVFALLGLVMVFEARSIDSGFLLGLTLIGGGSIAILTTIGSGCSIGSDEVIIQGFLGNRKTIPLDEIESVRLVQDPLRRNWMPAITTRDDKTFIAREFVTYRRGTANPVCRFVADLERAKRA
jgi:hypothetical protein